jgi:hypothetical protein
VVKGAVLQRQLCHQSLWGRAGRSVGRRTIRIASSGLVSDRLVRLAWMLAVLRSSMAGWVVYRRTHDIQPSSLPSCSNETR